MKKEVCRVLLVEDNDMDAVWIEDALSDSPAPEAYQLERLERLRDARRVLETETFDIILLDLMLPDSEGLETVTSVREVAPNIPVVVISGLEDVETAIRAVREGAQEFVVKDDWSQQMLLRVIRHALERHRLLKQRDETETALRESEARFRAVLESASDLISIKDRHLRFTHVNPAMEKLHDVKAEDLYGRRVDRLYGTETAKQLENWDKRVLGGSDVEEEHTRTVGEERLTFHDVRVPLRNPDGDVIGVCCLSRNVTERARASRPVPTPHAEYPSPAMKETIERAARVAATDGIILLLGESGSGKDFLARWIHDHSKRADSPYFALNCAALSPELAESELFGHEPGSFTGARGRKRGMLELAEGGTLLLNEIGELPLALQSKLLTFLDTRSFMRVGGQKSITVDARLIAATHRDLEKEVEEKRFLEPLYYRLNVFAIRIPPLRDRPEDIPILVDEMIGSLAQSMELPDRPQMNPDELAGLAAYNWPGNVRELRNVIERALMLWDGDELKLKLPSSENSDEVWSYDLPFPSYWSLRDVTDEVTKSMCMEALRRTQGNKKEAARILGISRDALYRYLRRFHIEPELLT